MESLKPDIAGSSLAAPLRGTALELASAELERLPKVGGWLRFESGWLDPEQALRNLETVVSLLQTVGDSLEGFRRATSEALMALNAHWIQHDRGAVPTPELTRYLRTRVNRIAEIARGCKFHGRGLLDGQSGVVGYGNGVRFVRGGPNTMSSPPEGFEVRILALASRASLTGSVPLHEDWLRAEEEIFVAEGDRFIRYVPAPFHSIGEFLPRFQEAMLAAGLDLEVGLTRQRRLIVRHNQYGSHFKFKGASARTPLLSSRPGKIEWSRKGKDIQGTMDGEPAFGVGRMLIGYLDNTRTSELAVVWRGEPLGENNTARCHVRQNGILFQDGMGAGQNRMRISLPSFRPEWLGRWLETRSGYASLADVRAGTAEEIMDSVQLLFSLSCEVDEWTDRVRAWSERYQNRALAYLRAESGRSLPAIAAGTRSPRSEHMARTLREIIQSGGDVAPGHP